VGAIAAFAVGFISHLWLTLDTETANAGSRAEAGSTFVFASIHPASRPTGAVAGLASEESDDRSESPPARSAFAERFAFDHPRPDQPRPDQPNLSNASSQHAHLSASFGDRFAGEIPPSRAPVPSAVAAPVAPPAATPRVAAVPVPVARPAPKRSSKSGMQLASASDTPVTLAYAPSDPEKSSGVPASPFNGLTPKDPISPADIDPSRTAIYDITSRTVYLPNGRRLEAHSGLGSHMDNPRSVHLRAVGPTPPNIYDLRLRESLFHGVRAIRLIPTDRSKMYGRDGILAHTYMLGPSGQSNGCVSFKDYAAFLYAFDRGEITRLVVVERLANPPSPKTAADWLANTLSDIFRRS
jgi:hypothetical protein